MWRRPEFIQQEVRCLRFVKRNVWGTGGETPPELAGEGRLRYVGHSGYQPKAPMATRCGQTEESYGILSGNDVFEKESAPASDAVSRASRLTLTLDFNPPFSDFPRRGGSARGAPNCARGARSPNSYCIVPAKSAARSPCRRLTFGRDRIG